MESGVMSKYNLFNDLPNFLDAEFDDTFKISLGGRIKARPEVKELKESVLGTAKWHKDIIWLLGGWRILLSGFIKAIKDKVTMLYSLILMCHLMTLTLQDTRLSVDA